MASTLVSSPPRQRRSDGSGGAPGPGVETTWARPSTMAQGPRRRRMGDVPGSGPAVRPQEQQRRVSHPWRRHRANGAGSANTGPAVLKGLGGGERKHEREKRRIRVWIGRFNGWGFLHREEDERKLQHLTITVLLFCFYRFNICFHSFNI